MNFKRGDIAEFEVRFARMASANAAETGAFGARRLLPATWVYREMEAKGALTIFLAYTSEGAPAGYQIFLVSQHPHYAGVKTALADAVYVKPEFRGLLGGKFLLWADAELKHMGVDAVLRSAPKIMGHGGMLERAGYKEQETHYVKEL